MNYHAFVKVCLQDLKSKQIQTGNIKQSSLMHGVCGIFRGSLPATLFTWVKNCPNMKNQAGQCDTVSGHAGLLA